MLTFSRGAAIVPHRNPKYPGGYSPEPVPACRAAVTPVRPARLGPGGRGDREVAPFAAVEFLPAVLGVQAAPLLEEERSPGRGGLVADRAGPARLEDVPLVPGTGHAAEDHPVDAAQR